MKTIIHTLLLFGLLFASAGADAKKPKKRSAQRSQASPAVNCQNPTGTLACMACNCFNEAGNQGYTGQVAVGKVVMTRVGLKGYPKSVCGVVKQRKQFSWFNQRSTRRSVPAGHSCHQAARESLQFRGYFADHYYASYIRQPRWARKMRGVGKIGAHKFYSAQGPAGNIQLAQSQATGIASLLIAVPALDGLIVLPGDAT